MIPNSLRWAGVAVLFCCSGAALAAPEVHEHTLDNGLKILVKTDRRAPVFTSQLWYRVGSSYETGGYTGLSHMLEHMMFKGTKNVGPGDFSRTIAAEGGQDNAFTSRDYTSYYQNMAADRLEVSMRLESDRAHNLLLRDEDFAKEVEVVKEERRLRTENQPRGKTYEVLQATAFFNHGYGNPVIGWMSDLDHMDLDDLKEWYRLYYAPNNATLVVVGDVDPKRVFHLAEQYYGKIPAQALPERKPRIEPEQVGERVAKVQAPGQVPYVLMGYHTPVLTKDGDNQDAYALEVLSAVLSSGRSARLTSALVRGSKVASSVEAGYSLVARADGLFYLGGAPAGGHTVDDLVAALDEEVKKLQTALVPADELAKIKRLLAADDVYEQDSGFYQGMKLGIYESVGLGWQMADDYLPGIEKVTAKDIQRVAKAYLVPENRTVAEFEPQEMTQASAAPVVGGYHHGR